MTRARDLANIADGTFTATDLDLSGTLTVSGDANFDSGSLFVDVSANRVGIGTTSPDFTLDVAGGIARERSSSGSTASPVTDQVVGLNAGGNFAAGLTAINTNSSNFDVSLGFLTRNASGNGVERVRIDADGNVGIGTGSPSAQLHLLQAGGTAIKLSTSQNTSEIEARESGGSNLLVFSSNNSEDHVIINGAGNVGIGTVPSYLLHLDKPSNSNSPLLALVNDDSGASAACRIFMGADGNNFNIYNYGDGTANANRTDFLSTAGGSYFTFSTASIEAMRIDPSRNVSIGTTGTDFESAGRRVLRVEGSTNALISASDGTSFAYFHQKGGTNGVDIWNTANSYMRFGTNNAEAMRIEASGQVGIGTSVIAETLVLGSADSGSNFLQITNSTTTAANDRGFYVGIDANEAARILNRENTDMVFSTNNDEKLRIDSSGNLLVGSSAVSPAAADAIAVRYGIGVQAGSLSSAVALTAGTAADVIDLTDVIDSSQNGAGMWLVTIVRDNASYGTHFVGIFGANNTSITLYETLLVTGLTITVSGTTIRANSTSATDTFKTNVIPLSING